MGDVELASELLGPQQGKDDDVDVHAGHEDANHFAVLVPLDFALGREGESFADGGFDG